MNENGRSCLVKKKIKEERHNNKKDRSFFSSYHLCRFLSAVVCSLFLSFSLSLSSSNLGFFFLFFNSSLSCLWQRKKCLSRIGFPSISRICSVSSDSNVRLTYPDCKFWILPKWVDFWVRGLTDLGFFFCSLIRIRWQSLILNPLEFVSFRLLLRKRDVLWRSWLTKRRLIWKKETCISLSQTGLFLEHCDPLSYFIVLVGWLWFFTLAYHRLMIWSASCMIFSYLNANWLITVVHFLV